MKLELKKSLGQHFLVNQEILSNIYTSILDLGSFEKIIEVGPGMGALTQYSIQIPCDEYWAIEMDDRFVIELPKQFEKLHNRIIHQDVLTVNMDRFNSSNLTIIGNFPYNISTQIVFLIIENSQLVAQGVGMFQKEVAKRIASSHGSKDYGILSVLTQSMYDVRYLYDIEAHHFDPPPKVTSGVISFQRLPQPKADYKKLKLLVKAAFNQRRKMLSNSIKSIAMEENPLTDQFKSLRPEQLSIDQFCEWSQYVICK